MRRRSCGTLLDSLTTADRCSMGTPLVARDNSTKNNKRTWPTIETIFNMS
jgi:hypothetical protein